MRVERLDDERLLLTGRVFSALALCAVLMFAAVGLFTVGFLTVLQVGWLGVPLLVLAAVLAGPANALMRAQVRIRRRTDAGRS